MQNESLGSIYPTSDGTGFVSTINENNTTSVIGPNGVTYAVPSTTSNYETTTDKSGNSISTSATGWTDTVGRVIPGSYSGPGTSDAIDPSNAGTYGRDPIPGVSSAVPTQCPTRTSAARTWNVPEPSSTQEPYYLCYENVAFSTAFNIDQTTGSKLYAAVSEASGTAPNLLKAIVLPNGTSYTFAYDQYLSLSAITLPTGGTITYVWQNVPSPSNTVPVTRFLKTRTLTPGAGQPTEVWTYKRYVAPGSNVPSYTVVTDPLGNDVEHAIAATSATSNGIGGYVETGQTMYAGCSPHDTACTSSGTLLRTDTYALQFAGGQADPTGGPWDTPGLYRHTSETTTLASASGSLTSEVAYTYTPSYGSCTVYTFSVGSTPGSESYPACYTTGQTASVAKYDYGMAGSGSPGALISTNTTTYQWQNVSSYFSANLLRLPSSIVTTFMNSSGTSVKAQETDYGYDESGSPQGAIGNQTSITSWLNTGSSPESTTTYNSQGMPTLTTDPRGTMSQLNYQCSGSLLKSSISPYSSSTTMSETTTYVYDCNSGYLTSLVDPNSVTTSYTYDALGRLLNTSIPNVSSVATSFNGDPSPPHVTTTIPTSSNTASIVTDTYYDGLGRLIQTKLTSDPSLQGPSSSETNYDGLGRVVSVTNAHHSSSSPTDGTTKYTYDALGRKIIQTQQDSSVLSWCYNGLATVSTQVCHGSSTGFSIDVTNELGATITQVYDSLSRLKTVFEPGQNVSICYSGCRTVYVQGPETDYIYDALNNLLSVTQQGGQSSSSLYRVRTFSYDSLSRLLASNNPEKASAQNPAQLSCPLASTGPWTECFGYDANGNETSHTDNRNIKTTLQYDSLNRITSKQYSDGVTPPAVFLYDSPESIYVAETFPYEAAGGPTNVVGRLAFDGTGTSGNYITANSYSYDALGRVNLQSSCTPRTCGTYCNASGTYCNPNSDQYDRQYMYDMAGNMTFAGRGYLSRKNAATPNVGYYYGGLTFAYSGSPKATSAHSDLPIDSTHPNQDIVTGISYTPLGGVASASAGDELGQNFTYSPRGWLMTISSTDLNGNQKLIDTSSRDLHGNILLDTDSALGQFAFCYGPVNQLYQAIGPFSGTVPACGSANGVSYSYDNFGNLLARTMLTGSGYQFSFAPNVHNQDPSRSYDAAGNLLSDGVHTYTYDAEGRISTVDGGTQYFYDAEGHRISEGQVGQTPTTDFLYDLEGRLVTTVGANFKMIRSSLYAAGKHWGDYTTGTGSGGGNTEYRLANQIGSLYYNFDQTGSLFEGCQQGVFGESLNCNPSIDFTETHFADEKRDQESNLDYMGARYYSSTLGRFMSPDPSGLAYADISNPQSLNLYSYAQNNPLTNIDPTGMDCIHTNNDTGAFEGFESGDCDNSTEALANTGHYVDGTVNTIYTSDGTSQGTYQGYDATSDSGTAMFGRNAQQPSDQGQNSDINPFGLGVIQQIGNQTGPTYSMADAFAGQLITHAACSAVGIGAGFKSFLGVPPGMMGGPYPGNASMLNGVRKTGGVATTAAATATGELLAAQIASPILSRAAARAVPVAGQVLAGFQALLALKDGDAAYNTCLGH